MEGLTRPMEDRKRQLLFCLACVFIWGLMAHAYGFLHSSFSHDSLLEFNGDGLSNRIRISNGRFLSPVCRWIFRTNMTLPWLVGVLGLLWIGLSAYLILRLSRLKTPAAAILVSGFLTANLTVSATAATFLHDFDCDMLALLMAVGAVFCWNRGKWGFLPGAVLVMLSLGLYQSYICVSIVLILFVCITELLDGEKAKSVIFKGLRACAMLLLGGIIYYVLMKLVVRLSGIQMLSNVYNSLDRPAKLLEASWFDIRYVFKATYRLYFERIIQVLSPFPAVTQGATAVLLAVSGIALIAEVLSPKVGWIEKLLVLILAALVPFGGNLMHFVTMGSADHELMVYSYWLIYLLPLLPLPRLPWDKLAKPISWVKPVCAGLIVVLICAQVQVANVLYLKKDLEQDAYLSVMTRVIYRMEDTEGYIPGETPVVMVGLPQQLNDTIPGFEAYRKPNGMWMTDVLNYGDSGHWAAYFKYILLNPAKIVSGSKMTDDPRVQALPCYPAQGCTAIIDGTLFVKLSEP